jgi:GDP-4-dehydro-6-deoxy-D-mannose reductase
MPLTEQRFQPARETLLVTGSSGFVGRHIAMAVREGVYGNVRIAEPDADLDVRDPDALTELVGRVRPSTVIHLAAQSFVPRSFEDPRETFEINLIGTLNLLQALRSTCFGGRLLFVSSGDVYGLVPDEELPVDESRRPEPRNPYAASKLAAEELCLQWHRSFEFDVVIARPFNHIGPGQADYFVVPSAARQIKAIASGASTQLRMGNVDASRDFTDVRDIVRAYAALLSNGVAGGIYVVGNGVERTIRDLVDRMCELVGVQVDITEDPALFRPMEQRRMCANAARLNRDTGWRPHIPLDVSLKDILEQA